jgi:hypothetical protein
MKVKKKRQNYIDNKKFYAAMSEYKLAVIHNEVNSLAPPKISNYIGECIMKIAEGLSLSPNFINYCVDETSQALTKNGWVSYNDIHIGDDILAMDVDTRQLVWSRVNDVYRGYQHDTMFKVDSSTIDALVTPGHKFVSEKRGLIPIDDMACRDRFITMGEAESGPTEAVYSDEFVELVGWFVTEGSVCQYDRVRDGGTSHYIHIHQSGKANPVKCDRIERCIRACSDTSLNYVRRETQTREDGIKSFYVDRVLSDKILKVAPSKILITEFILSLTSDQRRLLIQTMMDGDGSGKQYVQKDRDHIDAFLILCTLSGVTTHCSYNEQDTPYGKCWIHTVTLSGKKTCATSKTRIGSGARSQGGDWTNKKHVPTQPYSGVVWCPSTNHGTFVCRRGSKIYVSGNTFREDMVHEGILNAINYINNFDHVKFKNPFAYFTQIMWYAFVRKIESEKKYLAVKHKVGQNARVNGMVQEYQEGDSNHRSAIVEVDNTEYMDNLVSEFDRKIKEKKKKTRAKKSRPVANSVYGEISE